MTTYESPTEPCDPATRRPDDDVADESASNVVATVETHENAPDECTLFPCDVEGVDLMTTWITAQADSFVNLESMR